MININTKKTKLEILCTKLDIKAKHMCAKMGCRVVPRVSMSDKINKNAAQIYPNGEFIINKNYLKLNQNNKILLHNLIAHECAHLADPDPRGHQHDESFMSVYRKFGIGIQNDPLYLGKGELLTTPGYAFLCPNCGKIIFISGKPRNKRWCSIDKTPMQLINVTENNYLKRNWRRINNHGNIASQTDIKNILQFKK